MPAKPEKPAQPSKPRRSDASRAEILRAARSRFAADGYQRATIRAIAADAGIDPSMVIRYYGSKAALFAAAVDVDLRLPDLTAIPKRRLGATLVTHFLRRWEGDPADDGLLTLLRSAATDHAAAERLRTTFRDQLVPVVQRLVGNRAEAAERAGLVATQMLGLALCRNILRLPPVAALDSGALVARIGPTVARYLTEPLPTPPAAPPPARVSAARGGPQPATARSQRRPVSGGRRTPGLREPAATSPARTRDRG
jgi:AcrR family transcriptional regulator